MTVGSLLNMGRQRLQPATPGTGAAAAAADLDAEVLLAHVLDSARARLKSHTEAPVDSARAQAYLDLIARRAAGEPLAYLTGRREFWSLELTVTPAVLIPRPETELLVERALALGSADPLQVADLGTGSGAVALALARANAAALGLTHVEFLEGSWFEPLTGARFELLVSNPPYVAADDPALADPALGFEPPLALTSGLDGLAHLRLLARGAPAHLAPGGWLLLEHGATQGAALRHELVLAGFAHVRSHRDLAGHERMTEGQR
jgi:release factor glutamine methyltransferase